MTNFDTHSLESLEKLCRIKCTPQEEKEILLSMQSILDYVNQLNEIDTRDTPPCHYVLKEMIHTEWREDVIGDILPREAFLANAPDQTGGMIRVPPVIKGL